MLRWACQAEGPAGASSSSLLIPFPQEGVQPRKPLFVHMMDRECSKDCMRHGRKPSRYYVRPDIPGSL